MKRKLIKQLFNEWQSNIWLIVELIIVGAALWFINNTLFSVYEIKNQPNGYTTDNVYVMELSSLNADNPEYTDTGSENQEADEINAIIERLKLNPEVLSVGTGINILPYNFSYYGSSISVADGGEPIISSSLPPNLRFLTPETAEVISINGAGVESPKQIKNILEKGEVLLSSNILNKDDNSLDKHMKLIGRRIYLMGDSSISYRIGGIITPMKRYDYENPKSSILIPIKINSDNASELRQIVIKVKPGTGEKFKNNIEDNIARLYAVGNTYAIDIKSMNDIRDDIQRNDYQKILESVTCILFLITSIFLGLLGTFWFRTCQRTGEIAIRKVNGATDTDIFRRLISEGLLLLVASIPFVIILDILIVKLELTVITSISDSIYNYIITFVITYIMLAAMIILGIFFPAKKAMGINPAEALKDE